MEERRHLMSYIECMHLIRRVAPLLRNFITTWQLCDTSLLEPALDLFQSSIVWLDFSGESTIFHSPQNEYSSEESTASCHSSGEHIFRALLSHPKYAMSFLVCILCLILSRHVPTPILLGIDSIGIDGVAVLVGIDIDLYSLNTHRYRNIINTNTFDTNPPRNTRYSTPIVRCQYWCWYMSNLVQ